MKTQETKTESPFTKAQIEELRRKTREVLTPKEFAHLTPYYQKKKLEEYKTMQQEAPNRFSIPQPPSRPRILSETEKIDIRRQLRNIHVIIQGLKRDMLLESMSSKAYKEMSQKLEFYQELEQKFRGQLIFSSPEEAYQDYFTKENQGTIQFPQAIEQVYRTYHNV